LALIGNPTVECLRKLLKDYWKKVADDEENQAKAHNLALEKEASEKYDKLDQDDKELVDILLSKHKHSLETTIRAFEELKGSNSKLGRTSVNTKYKFVLHSMSKWHIFSKIINDYIIK